MCFILCDQSTETMDHLCLQQRAMVSSSQEAALGPYYSRPRWEGHRLVAASAEVGNQDCKGWFRLLGLLDVLVNLEGTQRQDIRCYADPSDEPSVFDLG